MAMAGVWSWLVPAIGSFAGVIVGGYISSQSARDVAQQTALDAIKSSAYSDFVNAQATYQRSPTGADLEKVQQQIRQASFRLAVFAPPEVVTVTAAFVREVQERPKCNRTPNDLAMYRSIRKHVLNEDDTKVSDAELAMVLFGCQI